MRFTTKDLAHLTLLSVALLGSTLSADTSSVLDGPAIVLGAFEVAGESKTASSVDPISPVTFMGVDQIKDESVDYPLELFNKLPGVYLTDFNQGVITADVSMRGFNGEGSSPHTRLVIDDLPRNLNNGYNDMGAIFPLEMATHDLFRARDVATRIGIMRHGKLEQDFAAHERTHLEIEELYLETCENLIKIAN